MVPLAEPERTCYVTMPESPFSTEGQVFSQEIRKRAAQASVTALDPAMPREAIDTALEKLSGCPNYVAAAYTTFAAYRGTVGMLGGELGHALESLIATGKPVALIALGNPYVLRNFPNVSAYLATFSNVPPSEIAAVKALLGETGIQGRLPVSIPGQAQCGEGIQMQATRPVVALRTSSRATMSDP